MDEAKSGLIASSQRAALVIAFLLALLILWQVGVSIFDIPEYILPAPLAIFSAITRTWEIFVEHILATLNEVLLGLGAGLATGLILAAAMSRSETLRTALYVPILATQTTPTIAIAPILVIWFGVGLLPKVIVITIFAFFPVLVNTLAGLEATGRNMIALMNSVSATRWQIYRNVRLPMALPHIFAGFRLAAASAVIGAVVVEWVTSVKGLGYLLILYQSRLNIDKAFATLVILMTLGVLIFGVTAVIENRFSWTKRLGIE